MGNLFDGIAGVFGNGKRRKRTLTLGWTSNAKLLYTHAEIEIAKKKGTLLVSKVVNVPFDKDEYVVQKAGNRYEIVEQEEATGRIVAYFLGYPPRFGDLGDVEEDLRLVKLGERPGKVVAGTRWTSMSDAWSVSRESTPKRITISAPSRSPRFQGKKLQYRWDGTGYKRQGQYLYWPED